MKAMSLLDANQRLRSEAVQIARNYLTLAAERRDRPAWHATLLRLAADRRLYAARLGNSNQQEGA